MDLTITSSVQYVPRVGPMMAKRLEKLDIKTVEDLLWYAPFRYNDFSLTVPIASVQPGETVTIRGTVDSMVNLTTKKGKRIQRATVSDESGSIAVIWFNQPFLTKFIVPGQTISLSGTIGWFGSDKTLSSPEYELPSIQGSLHTGRLVPVYPETGGVSSKWLRSRIAYVLDAVANTVSDCLPESIKDRFSLLDLPQALRSVHFPETKEEAASARHRLAFDELLIWQLRSHLARRMWDTSKRAKPLTLPTRDIASVIASLPFVLTADQTSALKEILEDITRSRPMNRLLIGDVGSGKTVVAAIAMYVALRNGFSSALMAPTEILAQQHFSTIQKLFAPFSLPVSLVTAATRGKRDKIAPIGVRLFIGTHALLSDKKSMGNLGLVVIDEQQRFGVSQRSVLLKQTRRLTPHLLTMTATPIPRTMARVLFGNLDLSILSTLPLGRKKVTTWVVPTKKRDGAYSWITKTIATTNGQAFIICPLIEESESLSSVKAVTTEFTKLKKVFPTLRLGLLHGRLKHAEKTRVLEAFRKHTIDILVATPVVEVGIDVPNATIMMIEAADRFGLGQLHQLRGRAGRGVLQSYCLLFTEMEDDQVLTRLRAMETIHSGPELSEVDLKLRGPGELFGTRQHGIPSLKIARLSDTETIEASGRARDLLTAADPELSSTPLLREKAQKGTIGTGHD